MLGRALLVGLRQDGHATDWVRTAADAHSAWLAPEPSLVPYEAIVLDLGLPDRSGLDLLRTARARGLPTPVLVVTARDRIADRVAGLDAGADDYMVKPIDLDELGARLRALDRRRGGRVENRIMLGDLAIDPAARSAILAGRPVDLTAREFTLLVALARRPGAAVSREQLEEALYGWDDAADSNTIEVYIHHLRRKLGAKTIETLRGLGYRLVERTAR